MTGFFPDGCCPTGLQDVGSHMVCAILTDALLDYSRSKGNDLVTPRPDWGFPGLKAGDRWCLCVSRWQEAAIAGKAPPVELCATHEKAVEAVTLEDLKPQKPGN